MCRPGRHWGKRTASGTRADAGLRASLAIPEWEHQFLDFIGNAAAFMLLEDPWWLNKPSR